MRGERKLVAILAICNIFYHVSFGQPLDIVAGKSGEEQVKEALDRAEKESELAAKERNDKSTTAKLKQETEEFLSDSTNKLTRSSTDLKATLDKKVEELAKFHEKHNEHKALLNEVTDKADVLVRPSVSQLLNLQNKLKVTESALASSPKGEKDITEEITTAVTKEKENALLEDESDKKMVDMAKKLNNLVLKFQKKMGRLQHRPRNTADLMPERDQTDESTVKSIRGKPATHAPIDLAALKNALGLLHTGKAGASVSPAAAVAAALTGSTPKGGSHEPKLPYKEDTKLEDRLAMEAEEEKKFSNGDTYDDGEGGEGKEASSNSVSKETTASSLSPKEQASQEMQSYNALISTESNRELSQIQDEITKATQSSMGQVSVVGQKEQVNTEPAALPSLNNLGGGGDSSNNAGIDGGLSAALGGAGGLDSLGKSIDSLGGAGGLTEQFQGLTGGNQSPTDANIDTNSPTASESSTQQTSSMAEQSALGGNGVPSQQQQQQAGGDNQNPIEIGGSQEPVEMGSFGGGNPFAAGGGGGQAGQMDQMQSALQSFAGGAGGGSTQPSMDIGGGQPGLEQQQSMSFKKSKITDDSRKVHQRKHKSGWKKSKLSPKIKSSAYNTTKTQAKKPS